MMTPEEKKAAAQEILKQLGGHRFVVMTGAKNIYYESSNDRANLSFRFPGSTRANFCKIVVNAFDTYDVTFLKIRGTTIKTVETHEGLEGIYNDMLQDVFTRATGLNCTLGTMGR
jgi:hypothetical protein